MMLVVHPLGNAFVRALVEELAARGELSSYITGVGFHEGDRWIAALPRRIGRQLERRRYAVPGNRMLRRPWREAVRLLAGRAGLGGGIRHETGWASVDAVYQDLSRFAARNLRRFPELRGVYAYEDGAKEVFETAGSGLARCYDMPIGYWRAAQRIFREEAERQPEWAMTLDGLLDSEAKLARKDEELALASHAVVATSFAASTLRDHPGGMGAAVSVVPYGAPVPVAEAELQRRLRERGDRPLRVLFVGALTQRKGLSYLFAAMKSLGKAAELTVVGSGFGADCPALTAALRPHRHVPTLPHRELFELMQRHDVLVLPSLFEGFGLVLLEAMAQGVPVVATPHTAAPDLFAGEEAGFIVPVRSTEALAAALGRLAGDRELREAMALGARRVAARNPWSGYGGRLATLCETLVRPAETGRPNRTS